MPPTIAPSLTPLLDRARDDGLAPGTHGHLLMDHLGRPASHRSGSDRNADEGASQVSVADTAAPK